MLTRIGEDEKRSWLFERWLCPTRSSVARRCRDFCARGVGPCSLLGRFIGWSREPPPLDGAASPRNFDPAPPCVAGVFGGTRHKTLLTLFLNGFTVQRGQVSEMRPFCKEQISGSGWVRFGSGPGPVGSGLESGLIWFDLVFPGKGNRLTLFDMTYPCFSCPRVWSDLVESLV